MTNLSLKVMVPDRSYIVRRSESGFKLRTVLEVTFYPPDWPGPVSVCASYSGMLLTPLLFTLKVLHYKVTLVLAILVCVKHKSTQAVSLSNTSICSQCSQNHILISLHGVLGPQDCCLWTPPPAPPHFLIHAPL